MVIIGLGRPEADRRRAKANMKPWVSTKEGGSYKIPATHLGRKNPGPQTKEKRKRRKRT